MTSCTPFYTDQDIKRRVEFTFSQSAPAVCLPCRQPDDLCRLYHVFRDIICRFHHQGSLKTSFGTFLEAAPDFTFSFDCSIRNDTVLSVLLSSYRLTIKLKTAAPRTPFPVRRLIHLISQSSSPLYPLPEPLYSKSTLSEYPVVTLSIIGW